MSEKNWISQIEGRDYHIVTRALAVAIAAIEQVERWRKPLSDQSDMKELLSVLMPNEAEFEMALKSARFIFERSAE